MIDKLVNKYALLALAAILVSCSSSGNQVNINPVQTKQATTVIKPDNTIKPTVTDNPVIIDLKQKKNGASISIKINFESFQVKDNISGNTQGTADLVDHFLVYLIKDLSNSGYPANGNPLANIVPGGGPHTVANGGAASRIITFSNVGPSGSDTYYVAVRAQTSGNVDLIKDGNDSGTNWTGAVQGIAVSTVGATVDSENQVIPLTDLPVNPKLRDEVNAALKTGITLNPGNNTVQAANTAFALKPRVISTIAGTGTAGTFDDGVATNSQLNYPVGITIDSSDNVYITERDNYVARKITPGGAISTISGVIGVQTLTLAETGIGTTSLFQEPFDVAVDSSGNIYIADPLLGIIRKVTPGGASSLFAPGGILNIGIVTNINVDPYGMTFDKLGNFYIANGNLSTITKVTPAGIASTIAGMYYSAGTTETGIATTSQLNFPHKVRLDGAGNVYIAEINNHVIRKVTPSGAISVIAGIIGSPGSTDTGIATTSLLNSPRGLAVDDSGNVYVSDSFNHIVRKITPDGAIATIVGIMGSPGSTDTGIPTSTQLDNPRGLALDSGGNLYIADSGNHVIRKVF